jgi:spore germination protein
MEKSVNTRQAGLILIVFTIALKLSVLPAMITDYVDKNSYIVCLIAMAIDFICNIIIILIIKKLPSKTFFDLIKETLSKPVAIIIYLLMTIYFLIKANIALLELHDYYITSLFEDINPIFFLLVLTLLLLYLFNRSFRNIGRSLQVLFWPLFLGLSFTLIYPLSDIELTNLLPLFQDGSYSLFNGLLHTSIGFGDFTILLLLMGHISTHKKTTKTLIIYSLSAIQFVFTFYMIFQGAFGNTAVNKTLALSELPLHNPYPANIGRLEWLTIIIWTVILLIQVGILGKCATKCFGIAFNATDKKYPHIVMSAIVICVLVATYLKLHNIIKIATSTAFSITISTFHLLLIVVLLVSFIIYLNKNKGGFTYEKNMDEN